MPLGVGSRLGHYDVIALMGERGMGQVYQLGFDHLEGVRDPVGSIASSSRHHVRRLVGRTATRYGRSSCRSARVIRAGWPILVR